MISLVRKTGNKFLVEIDGFGPFPSSAAVENLSEMEFIGQLIDQKIMKNRAHRRSNRTVEAIKETTVHRHSEPRTTTLDHKDKLAKTLVVKVSLISLTER